MSTPGFILNRQLVAFYNNLHCCNLLVTSSTTLSRYYCYYTDRSVNWEISETMASKNTKKPKLSDSESASSASSESASDSDNSPPPPRKDAKTKPIQGNDSKTSKTSLAESSKGKADSLRVAGESEPTWDLGSSKFVTVREFKGRTYVNIREHYIKDGKSLPGKKGIALNAEQWKNICSTIDEVNQVLKK